MFRLISAVLGAALFLLPVAAVADDWTADKLRGQVLQLVDNQWQPLARGDVVPDSRMIRTTATGHVTFTRGSETIDLGPKTQIQIFDKAGAKPFTTVKQDFGSVSVVADIRNVQHFGVDTPLLAAVVKGTRFTVTSSKTGSSVSVRRGHVAVEDLHNHHRVLLSAGQTASIDTVKTQGDIAVSGNGKLPAVVDSKGQPVDQSGLKVDLGGGLVSAGVGKDGVSVGVGDLTRVNVGGSGGLVGVNVGGSGGGSDDGGGLLNVSLGGLHLKL
jgi:hypothetical protein